MQIVNEIQILKDKLELALQLVKQANATAEVAASQDQGLGVHVRKGDVDKVEFTRNHGFGITVYRGQRKGSASTSDFSDAAIERTVQAALDIAHYTAIDDCAGLAQADQMAEKINDLDLHHPWALTTEQAIEIALACEAAGLSVAGIDNSDGASVGTTESVRAYGNSHGMLVAYPQARHAISCALIAGTGGDMERAGWSFSHRLAEQLPDPRSIGDKAAQRAIARIGARSVPTGEFPVMFAAEIAGGLISHFFGAISGGNVYRHSSFLEGALGQALFPAWMTIHEQPQLIHGAFSAPVDGDGLATYDKAFIEAGVLSRYVLCTYSARQLNAKSTANAGGVRNVRCSTTHTLPGLLLQMGTGLLVTEVMGQGVNIVSGNYSRGAAGFWVENGVIQYPVSEVTIAGNLKAMFGGMVGVADDVDERGNIQVGSILLDAMTIAGKQ